MNIIYVLLPLPISTGAYAYKTDAGDIPVGSFVKVPLGNRQVVGVVWEKIDNNDVAEEKIKPIIEIIPIPPLNDDIIKTIKFISAYNMANIGLVLKMVLPNLNIILKQQSETVYSLNPNHDEKITEKRQTVISALENKDSINKAELKKQSGASDSVIKAMVDKNIIQTREIEKVYNPEPINTDFAKIELNEQQTQAVENIKQDLGNFSTILLDGVTGSGKTEVYFELIAELINQKQDKQVLILLPEIALSSQWAERFEARFGVKPPVWHSETTPTQKAKIWQGLINNTVNVVVGARSALFLPFNNLSLIVVDEEHDTSFKQEDTVLYNARDIAIYRANINNCPIILSSATPSLETWYNVQNNKYKSIVLNKRYGGATSTTVETIDMKNATLEKQKFISGELHEQIKDALNNNQQTLLFLNRKGYAPLTLCNNCGYRHQCNNCQSWLVKHQNTNSLDCHHCGYHITSTDECPECGSDEMRNCGPGVERIYEEIIQQYPNARVFNATSENINTAKLSKQFIDDMNNNKIDIVIGTQVIAKGYDFENIALVGIIDGDMALGGDDLRAGERTFQIIQQVSGRAGRSKHKGKAFIQTSNPTHPVIKALVDEDRNNFLDTELFNRKQYHQPPYTRFVGIIVSDFDLVNTEQTAKNIVINAPKVDGVKVLGPTQPHMPFLRNKHRRRILLNVDKDIKIQSIIKDWFKNVQKPRTTRIDIDIDPYSFF
ncbi:MAG: replication restart helicase PriA [Alphaproteobacteria bacterium]